MYIEKSSILPLQYISDIWALFFFSIQVSEANGRDNVQTNTSMPCLLKTPVVGALKKEYRRNTSVNLLSEAFLKSKRFF